MLDRRLRAVKVPQGTIYGLDVDPTNKYIVTAGQVTTPDVTEEGSSVTRGLRCATFIHRSDLGPCRDARDQELKTIAFSGGCEVVHEKLPSTWQFMGRPFHLHDVRTTIRKIRPLLMCTALA